MTTASIEWTRLESHASEIERIARMRGWPMSDEYANVRAAASAASRIATEPAPALTSLPAAKDLLKVCERHAAALDAWRGRTAVAQELLERANRAAVAAAHAAAPEITARLVTEANDTLVPAVSSLADSAPRELTGHESSDQLAEHAQLLRSVEQLSAAALDRAQLGLASDDAEQLGRAGAGWLFLDPSSPDVTVGAVTAALIDLRDSGVPTTLDRWLPLLRIGVRFAHVGEAAQRMAQHNELRRHAAHGPDGGRLADSRTIGELAELAATAAS